MLALLTEPQEDERRQTERDGKRRKDPSIDDLHFNSNRDRLQPGPCPSIIAHSQSTGETKMVIFPQQPSPEIQKKGASLLFDHVLLLF